MGRAQTSVRACWGYGPRKCCLLYTSIGGASVNKASITNVIIGTFLFQGIVTMTPTVMNSMIHMDMSEVIRIVVSNGMILYALTRKTEGSK